MASEYLRTLYTGFGSHYRFYVSKFVRAHSDALLGDCFDLHIVTQRFDWSATKWAIHLCTVSIYRSSRQNIHSSCTLWEDCRGSRI